MLHTATASLKSSNDSIRQPGLAGITEDVSESRIDDVENRGRFSSSRERPPESPTRREEVKDNTSGKHSHENTSSVTTKPSLQRTRTVSNVDKALPPIPGVVNGNTCEADLNERSPSRSIPPHHSGYEERPSMEGRMSSQSARPDVRDLYDAHGFKQKVKLGPRPSTDSAGRPDAMDRNNGFRPVSTLPAGLRMPTRKIGPHNMSSRPSSQQSQRTFLATPSQRERPPTAPVTPIQIPDRKAPIISHGLLTPAKTPTEAKSPQITPEKRRLMKALQMRQKQLTAEKSANALGIGGISPTPEHAKLEVDESIMSAITDASNPDGDPDLVHLAVKDLSKEEARNLESSPISIPETSDGPSTQASSITDDEDLVAHDKEEDKMEGRPAPSYSEEQPPNMLDEDNLPISREGRQTTSSFTSREADQSASTHSSDSQTTRHQTHELRNGVYDKVGGAPNEQIRLQEDERSAPSPTELLDNSLLPSFSFRKAIPFQDSGDHQEKTTPIVSAAISPIMVDANLVTSEASNETTARGVGESSARQSAKSNESLSRTDIPPIDTTLDEKAISQNDSFQHSDLPPCEQTSSVGAGPTQEIFENNSREAHDDLPSFNKNVDYMTPLEVPLPSIDEDEEMSLRPNRDIFQDLPNLGSVISIESQATQSQARQQSQDSGLTPTRPSTADRINEGQHAQFDHRRGAAKPPERLSSPEYSDEHFLSDDSFMEELKSATLQEAKPISVSKSPIKPVFPRSNSDQRLADAKSTRSVSGPVSQLNKAEEASSKFQLPSPTSSRSFSANQSLRPDSRQTPVPMPTKIGVSSGISQRIKALEQLSSRPTSPHSTAPSNMTAFITQRKKSFRSPPGTIDINGNSTNKSRPSSAYPSPSPSPEAVKSSPFNNFNQAGNFRPESVSVTATIVRDASNKTPEMPPNPSEPRILDLHQSPLLVEHQSPAPRPLSPLKPPRPRYARYSSARSGSSSSTEQKVEAPQYSRRDSFASILSRSSRAGSEAGLPRTLSDSSLSGITSRDETREEKKDSKRSRLMKRMSSISSMSRRSIANALSPSPKESPIVDRHDSIAETPSATVDVGDVNIQFPDTLVSCIKSLSDCQD